MFLVYGDAEPSVCSNTEVSAFYLEGVLHQSEIQRCLTNGENQYDEDIREPIIYSEQFKSKRQN